MEEENTASERVSTLFGVIDIYEKLRTVKEEGFFIFSELTVIDSVLGSLSDLIDNYNNITLKLTESPEDRWEM